MWIVLKCISHSFPWEPCQFLNATQHDGFIFRLLEPLKPVRSITCHLCDVRIPRRERHLALFHKRPLSFPLNSKPKQLSFCFSKRRRVAMPCAERMLEFSSIIHKKVVIVWRPICDSSGWNLKEPEVQIQIPNTGEIVTQSKTFEAGQPWFYQSLTVAATAIEMMRLWGETSEKERKNRQDEGREVPH